MILAKALISVLVLSSLWSPAGAWAQSRKITVGYSSDAPGSLATWLAKETGIFAKNGLDAELIRTRTTIGVMALLSGELDFIRNPLLRLNGHRKSSIFRPIWTVVLFHGCIFSGAEPS